MSLDRDEISPPDRDTQVTVASYRLTYDDLHRTMLEHWGDEAGFVSRRTVAYESVFCGVVTTVACFQVYHGFVLAAAIVSAFSGWLMSNIRISWKALKIRERHIDRMWEALLRVPLQVELAITSDGVRFARGEIIQTTTWLSITSMRIRGAPTRWVVTDNTGDVSWVPATAFETPEAFEAFADEVYECWQSAVPSGEGFEVIVPDSKPG